MKEFKNKSEMTKNQMGSESYEAAAEELKKDEKKLAVSPTHKIYDFNHFTSFRISSRSKRKSYS